MKEVTKCAGIKMEFLEESFVRENISREFGMNFMEKITYTLFGPCYATEDPFKEVYTLYPNGSIVVKMTHEGEKTKQTYNTLTAKDYFDLCIKVRDLLKEADFYNLIFDDCGRTVRIDYGFRHVETMDGCYGTKDKMISTLIGDYLEAAKVDGFVYDDED